LGITTVSPADEKWASSERGIEMKRTKPDAKQSDGQFKGVGQFKGSRIFDGMKDLPATPFSCQDDRTQSRDGE
jgi:hypothetical protein